MQKGKYAEFRLLEGGKLGIKTYKTKDICDYAFEMQTRAYKLGCATKIIKRIDDYSILMEAGNTKIIEEKLKDGVYYDDIFVALRKKVKNIMLNNPYKKARAKHCKYDFTNKNLAMYNGKIVLIDFV